MEKSTFILQYKPRIRVHFNYDELFANPSIQIIQGYRTLYDFLEYYIPKYSKNGKLDSRPIEESMNDPYAIPIKLKNAIALPQAWDLAPSEGTDYLPTKLWPVPIATDSSLYNTLVLDSNHTICSLIKAGRDLQNTTIPCVEIIGDSLGNLGTDLKLLERTS